MSKLPEEKVFDRVNYLRGSSGKVKAITWPGLCCLVSPLTTVVVFVGDSRCSFLRDVCRVGAWARVGRFACDACLTLTVLQRLIGADARSVDRGSSCSFY